MNANPGSREARDGGCICPVMDNNNGRGYFQTDDGPVFVMHSDCPMHGDEHVVFERDRSGHVAYHFEPVKHDSMEE